mgnify:CR=1 FL=1
MSELSQLLENLQDTNRKVRWRAAAALRRLGDERDAHRLATWEGLWKALVAARDNLLAHAESICWDDTDEAMLEAIEVALEAAKEE